MAMSIAPASGAEPAATLAAVATRMHEVLQILADDWRAAGATRSDVLGDDDVPQLLTEAVQGGKRLRPELAYWGWVAAGEPGHRRDQLVDLGAAVELLHVFALIHDDVMDRSELRRGRPTLHARARDAHVAVRGVDDPRAFGDNIAILAGDLLHSEVLHLVSPLPAQVRELWRQMMIELVLGQKRDLTGTAVGRRDLAHSLEVARLKSGSYTVEGPLLMGAALAGAPDDALGCLRSYADHAGRAFGLRDDVLGVWGDPRSTGKSRDDDLAEGKATVLMALASERLGDDSRALLDLTGTGQLGPGQLEQLRREMTSCGVREAVEDLIADEIRAACDVLGGAQLSPAGVRGLRDVAERVGWRQS